MELSDLAVDGNAIAGSLAEIFAVDVTSAQVQCDHCGATNPLADEKAYVRGPRLGAAMRQLLISPRPVRQGPRRHLARSSRLNRMADTRHDMNTPPPNTRRWTVGITLTNRVAAPLTLAAEPRHAKTDPRPMKNLVPRPRRTDASGPSTGRCRLRQRLSPATPREGNAP